MGTGLYGGVGLGGGISVGTNVIFGFTGFQPTVSIKVSGSMIAGNQALGGDGISGPTAATVGRRHLVRPAHAPTADAPTAEQHRQQRDHGRLRPGGLAGAGGMRRPRPRRWPLRRHRRLGQPPPGLGQAQEIARHPELRLHQRRQHRLWHGDLTYLCGPPRSSLVGRTSPRTHHQSPGGRTVFRFGLSPHLGGWCHSLNQAGILSAANLAISRPIHACRFTR